MVKLRVLARSREKCLGELGMEAVRRSADRRKTQRKRGMAWHLGSGFRRIFVPVSHHRPLAGGLSRLMAGEGKRSYR